MNHPPRSIPGSFLRLVFLATTLLAPAAAGFETLGMSWPTGRINYKVNPNFPDEELSGTPQQQIDLITCSADCWREQTELDLRFVYLGRTEAIGFDDQDGLNTVSWADADVGDALAITIVSGIRDRIIGFDMVFFSSTNGRPNQWNGPRDPSGNAMDLRGIATHEFGHVLGLDHSADRAATMFASAINRGQHMRTLHEDDIAGGESLYQIRTGANPATRIIEVAPTSGSSSGGNEVELRGRNFTWDQDSTLWIGDKFLSEQEWTIEGCCLVRIHSMPPGTAGEVDIRITGELGEFIFAGGYRYEAPPPSATSIEPAAGPASGGIPIAVLGRDFSSTARLLVGGNPVEDSVRIDSGMILGTLPRHSGGGPVDIMVTQEEGQAVLEDAFSYHTKVLRIADTEANVGARGFPIDVLCTTDLPLAGVSFSLSYPAEEISLDSITNFSLATAEADFAVSEIDNDSGIATFWILMSFDSSSPSIAPGEDTVVARILASLPPQLPSGIQIPLNLTSGLGSPVVNLLFIPLPDRVPVTPLDLDGVVITRPATTFLRADTDLNGSIELTDAVFLLDYLFRSSREIPCQDSADANDDGKLDISDGIFVLRFLFSGGSNPPAPFPSSGGDPTLDDFGC